MPRVRWNLIWLRQFIRLLIVTLVDLAARAMLHIAFSLCPDVRPSEVTQYILAVLRIPR